MEEVQHSPQNSAVLLKQSGSASSIFLFLSLSLFCPQENTEEALLLLLISESMVNVVEVVRTSCYCTSCLELVKLSVFACVFLRPTVMPS